MFCFNHCLCFFLVVKSLLVATLLVGALTQVRCFNFSFLAFPQKNVNDFIFDNSNIFLEAIQVTPGAPITNIFGQTLYKKQFKLWSKSKGNSRITASFNSTFIVNINPQTNPGSEGLAFILGDTTRPENSTGKWLGIVNTSTNGSSKSKIMAVEFDTRKGYLEDIDDNHVSVDVNSIHSMEQKPLSSYGVNLSTSTDVTASVQYDGERMTVFVSIT